jgi:putative PIN family toxin of toxin-antitoxin system
MLAVIDTNVWISSLLNPRGSPAQLLKAFVEERFTPVMSEALLAELTSVLSRPRLLQAIVRRIIRYDIQLVIKLLVLYRLMAHALINALRQHGVWVELRGDINLCRDPHDNMVLETALLGKAEYLVTRDDDLKRDLELIQKMAEWGIQVVSVQQFLNRLSPR